MYILATTLTVDNAKSVLEAGFFAIAEGQLVFDLSQLQVLDSVAVATLLAWQRAAHGRGATLHFIHCCASLQSLVQLYGVTDLLHTAS